MQNILYEKRFVYRCPSLDTISHYIEKISDVKFETPPDTSLLNTECVSTSPISAFQKRQIHHMSIYEPEFFKPAKIDKYLDDSYSMNFYFYYMTHIYDFPKIYNNVSRLTGRYKKYILVSRRDNV